MLARFYLLLESASYASRISSSRLFSCKARVLIGTVALRTGGYSYFLALLTSSFLDLLLFCYFLAAISSGFSFLAIGGLLRVLTTLPFIIREVTLFLK